MYGWGERLENGGIVAAVGAVCIYSLPFLDFPASSKTDYLGRQSISANIPFEVGRTRSFVILLGILFYHQELYHPDSGHQGTSAEVMVAQKHGNGKN